MLEKAQQGIWPSFAPIGYLNVAEPGGRKIIIDDPHLGPLVTRLFGLAPLKWRGICSE